MERLFKPSELGKTQKILYVLLGALLMGTMWRVRGDSGWGSSWGLLAVGLIFALFVSCIFGYRKKATPAYIALTALAFMLTAPAWGPLLEQITGTVLETTAEGMTVHYSVSPWSGVILMLCLGFGMCSLFAFMLGRLFSERTYRWYHFVLIGAVYLVIEYAAKMSVSHLILKLLQPETGRLFLASLTAKGQSGTLLSLYARHFGNLGWAKKFTGGRNYFSEVEAVSRAIAALGVWLTVRFGLKDKISGRLVLAIQASFAFAITVSDLSFFFGDGGLHRANLPAANSFFAANAWPFWEYMTGFLAGGLITLALLRIPKMSLEKSDGLTDESLSKFSGKIHDLFGLLFVYGFGFAASLVRPVGERLRDLPALQIAAYAVLGVATVVIGLLMLTGKIPALWKADAQRLSVRILPPYFAATVLIYCFVGLWSRTSANGITANIIDLSNPILWIVIVSCVLALLLCRILFAKSTSNTAVQRS